MMGFRVDQAKGMFFDRKAVVDAVDRATRSVLSKFGAFVRRSAKSSIRQRKRSSTPGDPPSSHTGILKRFIYFGYDRFRRSVVIGPTIANMVSFTENMRPTYGTIPHILEYGGSAYVMEVWDGRRWTRKDLRRRGSVADVGSLRMSGKTNVISLGRPVRKRKVTVAERPYMRPALAKEYPKLSAMWRNSVRAA